MFEYYLMYVSTLEHLKLMISESNNPMQSQDDIRVMYEPGPWDPAVGFFKKPILHVGYLDHVLCRGPLIPCFLDGSSTKTIPHSKN